MLIASDCHEDESIGPETPLITAVALVKVTDPKFGQVRDAAADGRGLDDPLGRGSLGPVDFALQKSFRRC